jgi:hypothetical protein
MKLITILLLTVLAVFSLPYTIPNSELRVTLNKGLLVGVSYSSFEDEEGKDHYFQLALGIVVFTFIATDNG